MMGLEMNCHFIRGTIDSGASKSIMDIGTLEWHGLKDNIAADAETKLTDASNNPMDILGNCTIFRVNTDEKVTLPARTETVLCGRSKPQSALFAFDFAPKLIGMKWVYMAEAKVQPDIDGHFLIPILNEVKLNSRSNVGGIYLTRNENSIRVAPYRDCRPPLSNKNW